MTQLELTDKQWNALRKTLVSRFGEDIAQDTLLKLWGTTIDPTYIKHLTAFTCTLGARLVVDGLRRKEAHTGSLEQYLEEKEGETLPESLIEYSNPETQMIAQEVEAERATILAQLPPAVMAMKRNTRHYHIKKLAARLRAQGVICPEN